VSIQNLTGFESFEGATSRIGGLTPSTLHCRNGGHGAGINGLGLMIGDGLGLTVGTPSSGVGTVGFAFKWWKDKSWGGEVRLVDMYNGIWGITKAAFGVNAQGCLTLWSYDADQAGLVFRAVSGRAIRPDAWHYIECVYGAAAGALSVSCDEPQGDGIVSIYVNGHLFAAFSGSTDLCPEDDPDPYHPKRGVTNFHIGVLGGFLNEERHFSYDDVYAAGGGSVVGDVFAAELELEADADLQEWTPVPGPTHLGMVNEDPADDAATYNAHQTVGYKRDSFSVVDVPGQPGGGGEVLGIQLSARMRKTRTAVWRYQPWLIVDPYICYHLGEPLVYDTWTQMTHRVFWEAPGPPDEDGYIIGHPWSWEEVQAMRVGYVAWPPNFFFDTSYLNDNFPAVFIQV